MQPTHGIIGQAASLSSLLSWLVSLEPRESESESYDHMLSMYVRRQGISPSGLSDREIARDRELARRDTYGSHASGW